MSPPLFRADALLLALPPDCRFIYVLFRFFKILRRRLRLASFSYAFEMPASSLMILMMMIFSPISSIFSR